jgi:hypothetical protein
VLAVFFVILSVHTRDWSSKDRNSDFQLGAEARFGDYSSQLYPLESS